MTLSRNQALKAAEKAPNSAAVQKGRKYQSRLRLMSVPYDRGSIDSETAWHELLNGLKGKLSVEKYNAITKYFVYPMPIVNISNDIALDLYKVFDARNSVFSVDYPHDRIKEVGQVMLDEMDVRNWIEEKGRTVLKCAPNTVVVLDKDENGDILLVNVPNEKLLGYAFDDCGEFEHVVFLHSEGEENGKKWQKIGVYDDSTYWVVLKVDDNYSIYSENTHTLGSCPARFFYDNPLLSKFDFDREIPFSPVRGNMEQWTIFDLFQYYQKHFASFQVVQHHDNGCTNDDCNDGYIYVDPVMNEDNVTIVQGYDRKCPTCEKNALVGPGSSLGVSISSDKDEQDARDIFKFIAPEMSPLEYIDKAQKALENNIKENTVGYSDAITSDAINETQVKALVESRKKVLLEIKHYLEGLHKWIVESSFKLVYNVDVTANANYGTEWFILTAADLLAIISQAKAAGAQTTYIEQLNRQLIETEYKNDPNLSSRMLIAADLEPNPYDSQSESREKFKEGVMSQEDYYIKSNFTDLLARFERDNGSIVAFGKELPYSTKIDRIKATLLFYTMQKIAINETESTSASDTRVEQS